MLYLAYQKKKKRSCLNISIQSNRKMAQMQIFFMDRKGILVNCRRDVEYKLNNVLSVLICLL